MKDLKLVDLRILNRRFFQTALAFEKNISKRARYFNAALKKRFKDFKIRRSDSYRFEHSVI